MSRTGESIDREQRGAAKGWEEGRTGRDCSTDTGFDWEVMKYFGTA